MKKLILILTVIFCLNATPTISQAYYHGGYHDGYDNGFLAGLLASTAALFITHLAAHDKLAYVGAADEAAEVLAQGTEPSVMLKSVMDMERDFLTATGAKNVDQLNDQDLAYMILGRVTQISE